MWIMSDYWHDGMWLGGHYLKTLICPLVLTFLLVASTSIVKIETKGMNLIQCWERCWMLTGIGSWKLGWFWNIAFWHVGPWGQCYTVLPGCGSYFHAENTARVSGAFNSSLLMIVFQMVVVYWYWYQYRWVNSQAASGMSWQWDKLVDFSYHLIKWYFQK